MNYEKQLNGFYSILDCNPISATAISLYHAIVNIANKVNWIDELKISNTTLQSKSGLNISTLQRARNELVQKNFIEYKKRQ